MSLGVARGERWYDKGPTLSPMSPTTASPNHSSPRVRRIDTNLVHRLATSFHCTWPDTPLNCIRNIPLKLNSLRMPDRIDAVLHPLYRGMYKRYGCDASGITGGITGSLFGVTSTGGT
ncbi:unnamed protein product [Heligmosomoides polygyrus]|uniref:Uncharacterized protein n=1 Tax=Heligmosomoides polygyrus TaxID=6339 RepID=A0A183GVI6_HELPZ|nr:unnamed protein product [Heligmosomoides polygyrus]